MRPQDLWSRFEWALGSCFRCEDPETEVAVIGEIGARGIDVALTACCHCVVRLDQLHWTFAERQHRTASSPRMSTSQCDCAPTVGELDQHASPGRPSPVGAPHFFCRSRVLGGPVNTAVGSPTASHCRTIWRR